VVGYGAADKEQVQMMVMRLLNMTIKPQSDAADALAAAICHAHASGSMSKLSVSVPGEISANTIVSFLVSPVFAAFSSAVFSKTLVGVSGGNKVPGLALDGTKVP
jgi:hypothetical protein